MKITKLSTPFIFPADANLDIQEFTATCYCDIDFTQELYQAIRHAFYTEMHWRDWIDFGLFSDRIWFKTEEQMNWFLLRFA